LAGTYAAIKPAITNIIPAPTTKVVLTPGSVIQYSFNVSSKN